ncbi:MAG TPA: hypothetical protein VE969_07220 [Pyrinomonadaceae bacterium]|nr:hypothetical protein [Pyrinomonadaceae bacterium]
MSTNPAEVTTSPVTATPIPKRIVNAQTVCNQKNEKGKLCNGHLKQLKTAGEAAEVHLRGDDVLFKCHACGTLYMGPPHGHVRDPQKQKRFTEAELSALLQAAGGTMPVIKKNDKGVYVIVEAEGAAHGQAAKPAAPAAAKPPAVTEKSTPDAAQAASIAEKSMTPPAPAPKAAAEPNRSLNRRSTYAGVVDTGPVAGETKEQKIARLQKVVAGAKQRAESGGGEHVSVVDSSPSADAHRPAAEAQAETGAASAAPLSAAAANASPIAGAETPAELAPDQVAPATTPTPTSSAGPDRTLMKRSTYAGVVDTGPVEGETHEQKIERLTKVVAGAKQRAEGG